MPTSRPKSMPTTRLDRFGARPPPQPAPPALRRPHPIPTDVAATAPPSPRPNLPRLNRRRRPRAAPTGAARDLATLRAAGQLPRGYLPSSPTAARPLPSSPMAAPSVAWWRQDLGSAPPRPPPSRLRAKPLPPPGPTSLPSLLVHMGSTSRRLGTNRLQPPLSSLCKTTTNRRPHLLDGVPSPAAGSISGEALRPPSVSPSLEAPCHRRGPPHTADAATATPHHCVADACNHVQTPTGRGHRGRTTPRELELHHLQSLPLQVAAEKQKQKFKDEI